VSTQKI